MALGAVQLLSMPSAQLDLRPQSRIDTANALHGIEICRDGGLGWLSALAEPHAALKNNLCLPAFNMLQLAASNNGCMTAGSMAGCCSSWHR